MALENGNGSNGNGNGSGSTVESILKVLMSQLATISKAETVTGTPIIADKTTIIPVSKVTIGFAAAGSDAGGEAQLTGSRKARISVGGTGGGISVEPIAFIVVGPDGKPQLLPVKGTINSVARVIDLIPDVVAKLAALRNPKSESAELGAGETEKPKARELSGNKRRDEE